MSKIPISVCIIAKNEEKYIEECLKHLKKYDMEIVVTDTGSMDRTREIALEYADKVVDFEWINDFSAARNHCASHATNDWILSIDCDEYVTDLNIEALLQFTKQYPKYLGVLRMKNILISEDGEKGYLTDDYPRLYNRNFYVFEFPIHEQIRPINKTATDIPANKFLMPMEAIHHGYAISKGEMAKKQERNLSLLYDALDNSNSGLHKDYIYFQIGQSEFVLEHFDKAIEAFKKGLQNVDTIKYQYTQEMILSLAKVYAANDKCQEAIKLLEKYAPQCQTARYTFTHANILLQNEQILKALILYLQTVTMKDADTLGQNLMICYGKIIKIYNAMGEPDMAKMFQEKYDACKAEAERITQS